MELQACVGPQAKERCGDPLAASINLPHTIRLLHIPRSVAWVLCVRDGSVFQSLHGRHTCEVAAKTLFRRVEVLVWQLLCRVDNGKPHVAQTTACNARGSDRGQPGVALVWLQAYKPPQPPRASYIHSPHVNQGSRCAHRCTRHGVIIATEPVWGQPEGKAINRYIGVRTRQPTHDRLRGHAVQ